MTVPAGWQPTTLGSIGRYLNGRAFKKDEWSVSGRPIIRIQNLTGSSESYNHFQGQVEPRYEVPPGTLLVSWAATLGAYVWNGPDAVLNQHIFKVESAIDPKFHKYLLDRSLEELKRHTHGSGMVHITRGRFDSLPVAIPEAQEQRRIVKLIEEHFSHLDAADASLALATRRLDVLRDHLMCRAVTGADQPGPHDVTDIPTADAADGALPPLPRGWRWERLGSICDVVGGVTKDAKKQSDPAYVEVPYLRVANVQRMALRLDDVARIRVAPIKADALRLQTGDILLNEGGDRDKLARGWVWEEQVPDCIHQNHVFRARPRDGIDPYFTAYATNVLGGPWAERNGKQSVNLASISLRMIRQMPVPVPPPAIADSIAAHLAEQLGQLARTEAAIAESRRRHGALRRAVLAVAFSGCLTGASSDTDVIAEISHA